MGKDDAVLDEIEATRLQVEALREQTFDRARELVRRVRDGIDRAGEAIARIDHVIDTPKRLRAFAWRHPRSVAILCAGTAALGATAMVRWAQQRARESRPLRLSERAEAYRALLAHPERAVAASRSHRSGGLMGALLFAAAGAIAIGFLRRTDSR